MTYSKERIKLSNQFIRLLVLLHCGVGKDWAGPFSPPPPHKMFWSFFLSFSLLEYTTLSLYLNTYEWSIPMRESSFQTNKFIGNCGVGKDWAGPFFPPSKIFRSFDWTLSFSVYVTLSLYLNTYEWPFPKRESSFQTKQFICTATLWGGERVSLLVIPPPKCSNLCIFLSELILPNSGMGKDWADFPSTHLNNHFKLKTYSFCVLIDLPFIIKSFCTRCTFVLCWG